MKSEIDIVLSMDKANPTREGTFPVYAEAEGCRRELVACASEEWWANADNKRLLVRAVFAGAAVLRSAAPSISVGAK